MNKKFSTLVASLLLAGGIFSANAQVAKTFAEAAESGFYHVLKADGSGTAEWNNWSVAVVDGKLVAEEKADAVTKANTWKAVEVKVNGEVIGYKFYNSNGVALRFDKDGNFTTTASKVKYDTFNNNGNDEKIYAVGANGAAVEDKLLIWDGTKSVFKLGATGTDSKLYTLPAVELTQTQLAAPLETGFSITIGKQDVNKRGQLVWDGAYELEGNVFTGKLTPVEKGGKIMLQREDGKFIVLTNNTWGTLSNSLQAGDELAGYKFAAMSQAELDADAEKAEAKRVVLASTFTVSQPNALTNEPLEVVAYNASKNYELMVATVNGVNYLTTGDAKTSDEADQLLGKASYTYELKGTKVVNNTYVIFGDNNDVDYAIFKDAVWNISKTDANGTLVAGPSCASTWVPAAQVATAYPEGQWLYAGGTTFVNRESGVTEDIQGLRKIEGKELTFSKGAETYTFVKAGTPGHVTDAYLNGTDDTFLKEAFHIASPLAYGETVYLAKDEKNALYFTKDAAEAVEFRMKKEVFTEGTKSSDLIRHYTTYASAKTLSGMATDTLSLHQYFVTDAATGLKLAYDGLNKKYILAETTTEGAIIFKNKAEGLYNMVQNLTLKNEEKEGAFVNKEFGYYGDPAVYPSFCVAQKLYGAHNTGELKKSEYAYEFIENDLFTLTKVEAGQHVSGIEGDTIKIFRNIDNNYVLYESGALLADAKGEALEGFLAIQNFLDPKFAEKNPAMYVDGAAGLDTWRPEYMLALDAKKVDANNDLCTHCGKPECEHSKASRSYVEGRYLVNLVDSAKAGRKDCMFQNYGGAAETYYRLGFVQARHIGDTLAIASTKDSLNLTGNDFGKMNVCEFAFHYVDKNRDAFVIETAYDATRATKADVLSGKAEKEGELLSSTQGWVKFHNGIPVVTKKSSEAEVFDLEVLHNQAPTANEEVAVSEVSVVAVNGAVVVKGAAGKTVAISNILGQTIANTVIASDNETIAVPAGIVVVAVEGEEAVKAIVR